MLVYFGIGCLRSQCKYFPTLMKANLGKLFISTNNLETTSRNLRFYKRIFAFCIFSCSVLSAWALKINKTRRLEKILNGCEKININQSLFGTKTILYRCCGFLFPGEFIMNGLLLELPEFRFHNDDIVVASFPKSGTTWVQEIVYMLSHNLEKTNSSSEVLENRFPLLEYPYPGIKAISNISGKRLIKTHLPYTLLPISLASTNTKLIYITRNPRDVAVSYWHFMKLLTSVSFKGSFEEFIDMFVKDEVPYGPYYKHLKSYIDQNTKSNVLILSFEDLKKDPVRVITKIANFLDIPVTNSEICMVANATSFVAMSSNPSVNYEHWKDLGFAHKDQGNFLRKGEIGDWKNYFTPNSLAKFLTWESKGDAI